MNLLKIMLEASYERKRRFSLNDPLKMVHRSSEDKRRSVHPGERRKRRKQPFKPAKQ